MSIYKACDIRGIYGKDLTEEIALKIGKAVGTKLITNCQLPTTSVIGGDVRVSTPVLKEAIIDGLVSAGCEVIDIGIVPTPLFYFAIDKLSAQGGVMVTASHNPPEFNGFKLVLGDLPTMPEDVREIKELVELGKFSQGEGGCRKQNLDEDYVKYIHSLLESKIGDLKVVIDGGNGCFSQLAPRIFREFGYELVELYCDYDGSFPHRNPNPALKKSLQDLGKKVIEEKADLGMGFDGDGDRVVFVDDRGEWVEPDKSICLFVKDILKRGEKVVYDIKCSSVVPETVEECGGIPLPQKSGHSFLKLALIKEKAAFGSEVSGHFFFGDLGRDDSLYAALRFAQLIGQSGTRFSELLTGIPTYFTTPDIRIPWGEGKEEIVEKIRDGLSDYNLNKLDGVRVEFPDGWGLVRVSVTEPVLTFRFEAKTKGRLKEIMNLFLSPIPEVKKLVIENYDPDRNSKPFRVERIGG